MNPTIEDRKSQLLFTTFLWMVDSIKNSIAWLFFHFDNLSVVSYSYVIPQMLSSIYVLEYTIISLSILLAHLLDMFLYCMSACNNLLYHNNLMLPLFHIILTSLLELLGFASSEFYACKNAQISRAAIGLINFLEALSVLACICCFGPVCMQDVFNCRFVR